MSYARWSLSRFYVYHMMQGGAATRDEEMVDVDCEHQFTYKQLKDDFDGCLDIAATPTTNPNNVGWGVPIEKLREELAGYLRSFMQDIEADYHKMPEPPEEK